MWHDSIATENQRASQEPRQTTAIKIILLHFKSKQSIRIRQHIWMENNTVFQQYLFLITIWSLLCLGACLPALVLRAKSNCPFFSLNTAHFLHERSYYFVLMLPICFLTTKVKCSRMMEKLVYTQITPPFISKCSAQIKSTLTHLVFNS